MGLSGLLVSMVLSGCRQDDDFVLSIRLHYVFLSSDII